MKLSPVPSPRGKEPDVVPYAASSSTHPTNEPVIPVSVPEAHSITVESESASDSLSSSSTSTPSSIGSEDSAEFQHVRLLRIL